MDIQKLKEKFQKLFGRKPQLISRAPGRVNLIGEHTDYNNGYVLPVAIDRSVLCAVAARADKHAHLFSLQQSDAIHARIDDLKPSGTWGDYPLGVIYQLSQHYKQLKGVDALFWGDVPPGSGLSSSAAIEVATVTAMDALFALRLSLREKIETAHQAETEFVGVNCGIMDQYISAAGKADHALFLDCRTLESRYRKLDLQGYALMIIDSQKPRKLVEGKYGERRQECEEAVMRLRKASIEIQSLRDVTKEQLHASKEILPEKLWRRVKHVVSENDRVLACLDALRWRNLYAFGSLLLSSHLSLKEDYEVSCPELDFLVDMVMMQTGSLGARLTGAGFGGCTVNLVEKAKAEAIFVRVAEKYRERFGLQARMYLSHAAHGAQIVWRHGDKK